MPTSAEPLWESGSESFSVRLGLGRSAIGLMLVCYRSTEYESNVTRTMSAAVTTVDHYRFDAADLRVGQRRPGISAFMRIRDGAFSVEAAIRSHIGHYDEIVAVYNRCTDETPAILARLQHELGPKLCIFHYVPPVFPPGSERHRTTPAEHPQSLVNYYNFALSRTRYSHVTKLDDDHVAMDQPTARLVADIRAGRAGQGELACFSGLNLARDTAGHLGILAREPFAGSGDHWIFPVRPDTYFVHDRRFELLQHPGMPRRFHSFVYWHLKYLKPEFGFANYDLADNPQSRYARRLAALESDRTVIGTPALASGRVPGLGAWLARHGLPLIERDRIIADRSVAARALADTPLEAMMARDPHLDPFIAAQDSA